MDNNSVFIGTELKLNLHINPIGKISMEDYDFEIEVFTSKKRIVSINKKNCIRNDKDNYIMLIDTDDLGLGEIKCKVIAHIPDKDFQDDYRDEVLGISTGIFITEDYE